jgi:hypothetical protein
LYKAQVIWRRTSEEFEMGGAGNMVEMRSTKFWSENLKQEITGKT